MSYLSNLDLYNQVDVSGLLTRPVEIMKPVLFAFFYGSEQAVLYFYWWVDGERASVNSHVMEAKGPCPKFRAQYSKLAIPQSITA